MTPIISAARFEMPSAFASASAATVAFVPNHPSRHASGNPSPSASVHESASSGRTSVPSANPSPSESRVSGLTPAATSSPSEMPSKSVSQSSGSVPNANSSSRRERPSPSRSVSAASSAVSG